MQVLQTKQALDALSVEVATPVDAWALSQLYQEVYRGEYPCPELFSAAGMAEFLDFQNSHVFTVKIAFETELIGCVSCELKGRAAYLRGGMIAPAWQGRVGAGALFKRIFTMFESMFGVTGRVDYFYAETRTGNAKFHGILRDLGYSTFAILPRKDVFEGRRECEVIHVKYFRRPTPGIMRLTRRAAEVASQVLGHHVRPVSVMVPDLSPATEAPAVVNYREDPNGDRHVHVTARGGATLDALTCCASREVEKVAIHASNPADYGELIANFLAEMSHWGMEYVEIYAPADAPARQKILETLGFAPVGFLPAWHAPGMPGPKDCLLYAINFISDLRDCSTELIPGEEYLRSLVPEPVSADNGADLLARLTEKTFVIV